MISFPEEHDTVLASPFATEMYLDSKPLTGFPQASPTFTDALPEPKLHELVPHDEEPIVHALLLFAAQVENCGAANVVNPLIMLPVEQLVDFADKGLDPDPPASTICPLL